MAVEEGLFIFFPGGPQVPRYATECANEWARALEHRKIQSGHGGGTDSRVCYTSVV